MKPKIQDMTDSYKIVFHTNDRSIDLKVRQEIALGKNVRLKVLDDETSIVMSDNESDIIEVDNEKCLSVAHFSFGQRVKVAQYQFTVLKPYQMLQTSCEVAESFAVSSQLIETQKRSLPKAVVGVFIALLAFNLIAITQSGSGKGKDETRDLPGLVESVPPTPPPAKVQSWKKSAVIPVENKSINKAIVQTTKEMPKKIVKKPKKIIKAKRIEEIDEALVEAAFDPDAAKQRLMKVKKQGNLREEEREEIDSTINSMSGRHL